MTTGKLDIHGYELISEHGVNFYFMTPLASKGVQATNRGSTSGLVMKCSLDGFWEARYSRIQIHLPTRCEVLPDVTVLLASKVVQVIDKGHTNGSQV